MPVHHRRSTWLRLPLAACLLVLAATACVHQPAAPPAKRPDPNILWHIVHDRCVPAARQGRKLAPCVQVVFKQGARGGYVVMKDIRGVAQYLVLPTARVSGIESPQLLAPGAPDYLADAWRARSWLRKTLGRPLPRSDITLAINSIQSRTQNQLHIHVDCIRADVRRELDAMLPVIGSSWARLPRPLAGMSFRAMRVDGRELAVRPIRLLADSLEPGQSMGSQNLVVVGQRFADGREGFLLLAGRSKRFKGYWGGGENLQDHQCRIARPAASPG